jgi:hypothetical protein
MESVTTDLETGRVKSNICTSTLTCHILRQLPIKADSHFFRPILLKLAGTLKNGKNRIPLFCFSLKLKITKIFAIEFFRVFLMVYVYSDTEIDQILTVYRNQSVESKAVEIFRLSLVVFS